MDSKTNIWRKIARGSLAAGVLTMSLAMLGPEAVIAAETKEDDSNGVVLTQLAEKQWQRTVAVVSEITQRENGYTLLAEIPNETAEKAGEQKQQIAFLLTDQTPIIHNETGLPLQVKDLQKGDRVWVTYDMKMTRSLPPQTVAHAIVAKVGENATPAIFAEIASVTQKEDSLWAATADGNYVLLFRPDVAVTPFRTKNIVTAQDIVPGSTLFAWFDIMTLSIPAQAAPDKAVLVSAPTETEGEKAEDNQTNNSLDLDAITVKNQVMINGKTCTLASEAISVTDKTLLLPAREVGESLGYEIKWEEAEQKVTLTKGDNAYEFTLWKTGCSKKQGTAVTSFTLGEQPPVLDGSYALAPLDFWQQALGARFAVEKGMISITVEE